MQRKIGIDQTTKDYKDYIDNLVRMCESEVVYGVGDGPAIGAAKYVASQCELPLIIVPTVLSTDAFLTNTTRVTDGGRTYYLPSKVPDLVITDMVVLCNAPSGMRVSGAAGVLSIGTAMWDWQEAERLGKNPANQRVSPHIIGLGKAILQALLDNAREIGRGTPKGLTVLLDLLCLEVQLCYLCGHDRFKVDSMHCFVHALGNRLTGYAVHSDLVGLGIMLMASLQSQGRQRYAYALDLLQTDYRCAADTRESIIDTLVGLSDCVRQHRLPYSVVTDLTIARALAEITLRTVLE